MLVFGPVPSRRLGRSLGINNIPAKTCSYSCIYCQLGANTSLSIHRQHFYDPETIVTQVKDRVERCRTLREPIDFLTFVPDGEPTLDVNLGKEIEYLDSLGNKIAVLTNGSLVSKNDVMEDLANADLVSLKIDTVKENTWRKMNRPHRDLGLSVVLDGMRGFAEAYQGELITETMLIDGVNDGVNEIRDIAKFLKELQPKKAYIAIPTRPPAEEWARAASEESINRGYQIVRDALGPERVEHLIGYEGDAFASTGDFEDDLLSITSVHPMREDAVSRLVRKASVDWLAVERLIKQDKLIKIEYGGCNFYMRRLSARI